MRDWKDRLVKCGIPEKTAQHIVDFFFKHRRRLCDRLFADFRLGF